MMVRVAADNHAPGCPGLGTQIARNRRAAGVAYRSTATDPATGQLSSTRPRAWTQATRFSRRERLVQAMGRLACADGYACVTVADLATAAGVSRPSFYRCFSDREDCLLAALAPVVQQLYSEVGAAVRGVSPERSAACAVEALLDFARTSPGMARLAFAESLMAGPGALDARDGMVSALGVLIADSYRDARPATLAPDIPETVLVGATTRLLGARLGARERIDDAFATELRDWLASYEMPLDRHRWRSLTPLRPPARSPFLPPPLGLSAYRPCAADRISFDPAAERQRMRIIFASAEVVAASGYHAASVTEIARQAGLDTGVFYRLFADKREALRTCGELLFGHLMAVTAGAFVLGDSWPEHVWEASRAYMQCLQENPTLASVALVESHTAGASAARRARETAFTIFLEEGYRCQASRARPSGCALEALATCLFELAYKLFRAEHQQISGFLGHVCFIALAPFLTAEGAHAFLARQGGTVDESVPRTVAAAPVG
jgi:AcrR family transcriptional regulator